MKYYAVNGPRGSRTIKAKSVTDAARKYVGHSYVCWLDTDNWGYELFEDDAYGTRFTVYPLDEE